MKADEYLHSAKEIGEPVVRLAKEKDTDNFDSGDFSKCLVSVEHISDERANQLHGR